MLRAAMIVLMLSGLYGCTSQRRAERAACRDDAKTFCAGVKPGGGRILDCLAKQKDKISPACAKVVASHSH